MQRAKQEHFKDRSIFYTSRLINEQLPRGKEANSYHLRSVYFIGLLDFTIDDKESAHDSRYVRNFRIIDEQTGDIFYDKLHYKFIELPKFVKTLYELQTQADKWLFLIKNMGHLKDRPNLDGAIFDRAFTIAEINKLGKEERQMYIESSLAKWEWEEALAYSKKQGERKGIEKGHYEEKIAIAIAMKKKGIAVKEIAELTKLSAEEIEKL